MMQLVLSLLLLFAVLASFFFSPVVISSVNSSEEDAPVVLPLPQIKQLGANPIEPKLRSTGVAVPDVKSLVPALIGVGPASRSLLLDSDSVVQGKVLLVHEDGKLELKETGSESTLWEIQTDNPLPTLEQVYYPSDSEYFLFPGQGSELLIFTKSSGLKKHPLTIEEYVSRTPEIKGSNVIIGSKSSTLYTINADTGEIIYKNTLPVNLSQFRVSMDQEPSLPSLDSGTENNLNNNNYITIVRTDYTVSCSEFGKTIWNWSKSFFIAYYPNGNKYMLEPPKNNINKGGLIPIKIGVLKRDLLLADAFSEYTRINDKNAIKGLSGKVENGLVLSPIETINQNNENSLIISEKSFKSKDNSTESSRIKYLFLIPFFCISILFIYPKLNGSNGSVHKELTESTPRQTKKKKSRKNSLITENKSQENSNSEGEKEKEKLSDSQIKEKLRAYMQNLTSTEGKWVNKLFISNKEIGRGSNGTVVLEGFYEGRAVAIKRLLYSHHEIALKEIRNLIASDQHGNIVRLYGVEQDADFVYISLERCDGSLADLVEREREREGERGREVLLWREDGIPSPQLLKLMSDIVSGLAHLHELGIIHRDLKPQNVLIISEGVIKAKLSDMGISKRLQDDMSALSHQGTGCGSSGWQAPEQLLHGRQSRAVDLFSLGCVLFFCITKGQHPFGDYFERDRNIIKNEFDLFLVDFIPEAVHLFTLLLNPDPSIRPKAKAVLSHPFFWPSETRLAFLRDTSDRIDKANEPDLISSIESISVVAFGGNKWNEKLDQALISDLGKYRKYNFDSVRDLLRVVRNKSGHYRELSTELQESLGSLPEGFDRYFSSRFPKLLIEVYKVVFAYCREEDSFSKYFKSGLQ
ncbi:hypothetical protein LUZ60_002465 [Juncus effusus]|nr:hypothetical protein LUZ60_002465 [Juncus effusus]